MEIRDRITELRRVPASELRANPKNWRAHPKEQQAAMSSVLQKIGYADALLARETEDGLLLIDGHLRQDLTPDAIVPVLILDVDEDEADYLLATFDPLGAMAETDKDSLADLLADVEIENAELDDYLHGLLGREKEAPDISPEDDDIPEEAPAFSKEGFVWKLGDHKLIVGDSTDPDVWRRLMDGEVADMVWTDPPYGVDYVGKTKTAMTIDNDALSMDELEVFLRVALGQAKDFSKPGAVWYVAAPSGPQFLAFAKVLWDFAIWHQTIIWSKDVFVMGRSDLHWKHESIFYGWVPGAAHLEPPDRRQDTVWEIPRPKASRDHPTTKPVELVAKSIVLSSRKGELIVDCFGGSGTTLIASERTGRRCNMIEYSPKYADVICRRFQKATGVHPVLASTGEVFDFEKEFFEAQADAMSQGDGEEDALQVEEFVPTPAAPVTRLPVDDELGF